MLNKAPIIAYQAKSRFTKQQKIVDKALKHRTEAAIDTDHGVVSHLDHSMSYRMRSHYLMVYSSMSYHSLITYIYIYTYGSNANVSYVMCPLSITVSSGGQVPPPCGLGMSAEGPRGGGKGKGGI